MFFKMIMNLIYPHVCIFCDKMLDKSATINICENCINENEFLTEKRCEICLGDLPRNSYNGLCDNCKGKKRSFKKCYAPLKYKGNVRRAMLRFKFRHRESNARAFSFLMAREILKDDVVFDKITYVPQNKKNIRKRGFNQSELLARMLSQIICVPCEEMLIRREDSLRQSKLSKNAREENARKSYSAVEGLRLSGKILLTDDILTTGATANACARLLKKCGASEVYVAVATRNGK